MTGNQDFSPFQLISNDDKIHYKMPMLGLGTFKLQGISNYICTHLQATIINLYVHVSQGTKCRNAVSHALNVGYRLIDTAHCYKNEKEIGFAVKSFLSKNNKKPTNKPSTAKNCNASHAQSKHTFSSDTISRSDIFITSKLSPKDMRNAQKIEQSIYSSLQSLSLKYIDLYLIHWPCISGVNLQNPKQNESKKLDHYRMTAWKVMEKFVQKDMIHSIGVSNFEIKHLQPLLIAYENGDIKCKPAVNQIEYHPLYKRNDLFNYCSQHNIIISGYGSLGCSESHMNIKHPLLENDIILQIAEKYKKSTAQILLKWALNNKVSVIPKSCKPCRISENFQLFDFEIADMDMDEIEGMSDMKINRNCVKFAWNPCSVN